MLREGKSKAGPKSKIYQARGASKKRAQRAGIVSRPGPPREGNLAITCFAYVSLNKKKEEGRKGGPTNAKPVIAGEREDGGEDEKAKAARAGKLYPGKGFINAVRMTEYVAKLGKKRPKHSGGIGTRICSVKREGKESKRGPFVALSGTRGGDKSSVEKK